MTALGRTAPIVWQLLTGQKRTFKRRGLIRLASLKTQTVVCPLKYSLKYSLEARLLDVLELVPILHGARLQGTTCMRHESAIVVRPTRCISNWRRFPRRVIMHFTTGVPWPITR